MFRKLFRIFIVSREPSLLGRWSITDMKQNKIKIDWANVDHCGTCSYETPKKKTDTSKPTKPKTK
jgi:hypothetical protein